jgi:hypothetical protein
MSLVLGVGQEFQRLWRFLIGAWHVPTLSAASPAVTHPIHPIFTYRFPLTSTRTMLMFDVEVLLLGSD